jgi:hypothetical protein
MGHIAYGHALLQELWMVFPKFVSLELLLEDQRPCHPYLHNSQHGATINFQDPARTHKPCQGPESLTLLYGIPVDLLVMDHRRHHRRLHGGTRQQV